MALTVKKFAMDGHEKVATRCYDEPPVREGVLAKMVPSNSKMSAGSW